MLNDYILCCQLIDKIYKHSQQVQSLKLDFHNNITREDDLFKLELQMLEYLDDLEKLERKI